MDGRMPEQSRVLHDLAREAGFDFADYPKQWVISRGGFAPVRSARTISFAGWTVQAAQTLPVIELLGAGGARTGLLLGWPIHEGRLLPDGESLAAGDDFAGQVFPRLAGRFVCLWRARDGGLGFRLDAGGFLPAVIDGDTGALASTPTLLARLLPRPVDGEIDAIFGFPRRRGFLPFGLTRWQGIERLLPGHAVDLDTGRVTRVWPDSAFLAAGRADRNEVPALVAEAAELLQAQAGALLAEGRGILYLSGGHDSRIVLAACRAHRAALSCETLAGGDGLDAHVAAEAARVAGVPHVVLDLPPATPDAVASCLDRTGHTLHDAVIDIAALAPLFDRGVQTLDGTGAEITRGSNWAPEDVEAPRLTLPVLLARLRLPDLPPIRRAAEAWLAGLPDGDAARGLDLAKIEQIHGCWAGPAIYGHMTARPTIGPVVSQRFYEIALRLPKEYRMANGFYRDVTEILWPELGRVPVNRAQGLARLRFAGSELKRLVPTRVKRWVKPLR
jgi:hypothetical protein